MKAEGQLIRKGGGELVEVIPLTGVLRRFTYRVPEEMRGRIGEGMMVKVPFGGRELLGVVGGFVEGVDFEEGKLKGIKSIKWEEAVVTRDVVELGVWMQQYYGCSMESVWETVIPGVLREEGSEVGKKVVLYEVVRKLGVEDFEYMSKRSPRQGEVYEWMLGVGRAVGRDEIRGVMGQVGVDAVKRLVEKGVVEEKMGEAVMESIYEDGDGEVVVGSGERELSEDQKRVVGSIGGSIEGGGFKVHLLHGVTGAGKTEVYLRVMEEVLAAGKGVIFLVPEVSLTPQTVGRVRGRLGGKGHKVVVWHSLLNDRERREGWVSLMKGEAQVVVGARSAVFAPVKNLGLIIVDEEHDGAYKQSENPRYHGRDVAVYRSKLVGCTCILGSATPSLESLHNAQGGKYILERMDKRIDGSSLPVVHVVDMRIEAMTKRYPVTLSRMMVQKLIDRYEKREQSILFLNRRGFAPRLMCKGCEYVAACPRCSLFLTYHAVGKRLVCHGCGHEEEVYRECPGCRGGELRFLGAGTQKVEEALRQILPSARVARIDRDTMGRKDLFREILGEFRKGKIDVLIGTQMIAKGLDFPNVTLVGIVDADISLKLPDFRANERTFQLVVQVAGRAGRGDKSGEVVVQSYLPHSAPIQYARRADFDGFYEAELVQRKEFLYPPYRHMIRHIMRGKDVKRLEEVAEAWVDLVEKEMGGEMEIRGPAAAAVERVNEWYRYQVCFFVDRVGRVMGRLNELREGFRWGKDNIIEVMDVDPVDFS